MQGDAVEVRGTTLGRRIVAPDGRDQSLTQFQPYRPQSAARMQINGSRADRGLAWLVNTIIEDIAKGLQRRTEPRRIQRLAGFQRYPAFHQSRPRRHALQQGLGCRQDDARFGRVLGQPRQGCHALRRHRTGRAGAVVGQAIPGRQRQGPMARGKNRQGVCQDTRRRVVAGNEQQSPGAGLPQP